MASITALEAAILRNIAENNFQDGAAPEEMGEVWTFAIFDGNGPVEIDPKQGRGALTSCQNKGLVRVEGKGDDAIAYLTEHGFGAYMTRGESAEYDAHFYTPLGAHPYYSIYGLNCVSFTDLVDCRWTQRYGRGDTIIHVVPRGATAKVADPVALFVMIDGTTICLEGKE